MGQKIRQLSGNIVEAVREQMNRTEMLRVFATRAVQNEGEIIRIIQTFTRDFITAILQSSHTLNTAKEDEILAFELRRHEYQQVMRKSHQRSESGHLTSFAQTLKLVDEIVIDGQQGAVPSSSHETDMQPVSKKKKLTQLGELSLANCTPLNSFVTSSNQAPTMPRYLAQFSPVLSPFSYEQLVTELAFIQEQIKTSFNQLLEELRPPTQSHYSIAKKQPQIKSPSKARRFDLISTTVHPFPKSISLLCASRELFSTKIVLGLASNEVFEIQPDKQEPNTQYLFTALSEPRCIARIYQWAGTNLGNHDGIITMESPSIGSRAHFEVYRQVKSGGEYAHCGNESSENLPLFWNGQANMLVNQSFHCIFAGRNPESRPVIASLFVDSDNESEIFILHSSILDSDVLGLCTDCKSGNVYISQSHGISILDWSLKMLQRISLEFELFEWNPKQIALIKDKFLVAGVICKMNSHTPA